MQEVYIMNLNYTTSYTSTKYPPNSRHDMAGYGQIEILGKVSEGRYAVRFLNTGFVTTAQPNKIKEQVIRDWYAPTIYGKGIPGQYPDGNSREYRLWSHMIERCYCKTRDVTYNNCVVSEDWLYFPNFKRDIKELEGYSEWVKNKDVQLDKDIKGSGKCYSKDDCIFVHRSKNVKEMNDRMRGAFKKHLRAPNGTVFEVTNQREFCQQNSLSPTAICEVISGKREHHKGWRIYTLQD